MAPGSDPIRLALVDDHRMLLGALTEWIRQAADLHLCPICPLPDLGRALEAAGRPGEAVQVYERYLSTPLFEPFGADMNEEEVAIMRSTPGYQLD